MSELLTTIRSLVPFSKDWQTKMAESQGELFEETDGIVWGKYNFDLILESPTEYSILFQDLASSDFQNVASNKQTVLYTVLTAPLLGIFLKNQPFVAQGFFNQLPWWLFAIASVSSAIYRIQSHIAANYDTLQRNSVAMRILSALQRLPRFVEYRNSNMYKEFVNGTSEVELFLNAEVVLNYYHWRRMEIEYKG
jgi:hypothetical protein